ncbi:hypothetical protein FHW58_000379 [Duganella sp. 1224]|uniref:AraC family ligand binding domain-containing protein n=1 Tax=Duganella sp. 1224 TaxID=2587052 RepID=UPI0015CBA50A|nr:AraC family ligand binding domain-containing protein [Duganella sp. 1224]NYE59227.1 hypothetical protein [Duganella sp. 1224]
MIRCVRIWTSPDGDSQFEEGSIALPRGERGDTLSAVLPAVSISFRETAAGGDFPPHHAPTLQLVLTLSGTLLFTTASGASFTIRPGDVLLADDLTGSGHSWQLIDDQPWRRAYIIVGPDVAGLFSPRSAA